MSVKVTVEAAVEPTEDQAKVERALLKLFPNARVEKVERSDGFVSLRIHGNGFEFLSSLRSLIKQERIRSAARAILLRKLREPPLQIFLNKQAAFMGHVSFCAPIGESPHGPITIQIDSENDQAIVDYLATPPPNVEPREGRRR
jgi:predicted RNA binding protein with dsRBD fold (UPF0201 family)